MICVCITVCSTRTVHQTLQGPGAILSTGFYIPQGGAGFCTPFQDDFCHIIVLNHSSSIPLERVTDKMNFSRKAANSRGITKVWVSSFAKCMKHGLLPGTSTVARTVHGRVMHQQPAVYRIDVYRSLQYSTFDYDNRASSYFGLDSLRSRSKRPIFITAKSII